MKPIVFDGRLFATEKEASLRIRVLGLKTRGVYPKLASIIVGNNPASELYVNLKMKAAERIGAEVDIYKIPESAKLPEILLLIKILNKDETVKGIMVQMPIPGRLGVSKNEIINAILPKKDVDGLKEDSQFLHPTSKAVIQIIDEAKRLTPSAYCLKTVCVVGATGMVGRPLVKKLREQKYDVIECNTKTSSLKNEVSKADIVVSTTGTMNLITGEMVKEGAVVIDVGSPFGDVEFGSVSGKAGFVTPVPGGVGPVTITCLLENLISAC